MRKPPRWAPVNTHLQACTSRRDAFACLIANPERVETSVETPSGFRTIWGRIDRLGGQPRAWETRSMTTGNPVLAGASGEGGRSVSTRISHRIGVRSRTLVVKRGWERTAALVRRDVPTFFPGDVSWPRFRVLRPALLWCFSPRTRGLAPESRSRQARSPQPVLLRAEFSRLTQRPLHCPRRPCLAAAT